MKKPAEIQTEYYAKTASDYDHLHVHNSANAEHDVALIFLSSIIDYYNIQSILDIGAGTGRALTYIKNNHPNVRVVGIEPVKELRMQAYKKGISETMLIEGDGNDLNFESKEFDLVCEFGVLHHVPKPERVVSEMVRVANKGIFISDSNNFGQGSKLSRFIKQCINLMGLWKTYDFIRTKGKMYQISLTDGLFYSYSVFNNFKQIKKTFKKIHLLSTKDGDVNLYKTASHVALLAMDE